MIPATDFPVAGLPAVGSSVFSNAASISDRSRDSVKPSLVLCCCAMALLYPVFPSSLTRLYRIQHVTASIGSCGNHAMAAQCLVKNVPPASGGIVHATRRFLQSCGNIWRMTCFWWQLTYDIRLFLKEGGFKISVKKIPTFAKSWSSGSRRIGLQVILLLVLGSSQYPSRLCFEEVALLVSIDGEHPSSGHRVLRFDLPHVNEIKNLIVKPGFVLKMFRISKLFVVSSRTS